MIIQRFSVGCQASMAEILCTGSAEAAVCAPGTAVAPARLQRRRPFEVGNMLPAATGCQGRAEKNGRKFAKQRIQETGFRIAVPLSAKSSSATWNLARRPE